MKNRDFKKAKRKVLRFAISKNVSVKKLIKNSKKLPFFPQFSKETKIIKNTLGMGGGGREMGRLRF